MKEKQNTPSQNKSLERNLRISKTIDSMRSAGLPCPDDRVRVTIPDALEVLQGYMGFYLNLKGKEMKWAKEYNQVALWLSDNEGLGLFMYGDKGRGKTFLARYVIPAILWEFSNKVMRFFNVRDMNKDIDAVLQRNIIALDDIGTEEISNVYGNRRLAFAEVMDAMEKDNKLIVVTTNLNEDELLEKYGDRVVDRIKEMTKRVAFRGESFRGR